MPWDARGENIVAYTYTLPILWIAGFSITIRAFDKISYQRNDIPDLDPRTKADLRQLAMDTYHAGRVKQDGKFMVFEVVIGHHMKT